MKLKYLKKRRHVISCALHHVTCSPPALGYTPPSLHALPSEAILIPSDSVQALPLLWKQSSLWGTGNQSHLDQFPRAAGTKYHKLDGWEQQKFISDSSGGWTSETKVSVATPHSLWRLQGSTLPCLFLILSGCQHGCQQSLVLLALWLHHSNFCLHFHMVFSLYVSMSKFPSSYKDTSHWIRVHLKPV